jgi:hypothetical protein
MVVSFLHVPCTSIYTCVCLQRKEQAFHVITKIYCGESNILCLFIFGSTLVSICNNTSELWCRSYISFEKNIRIGREWSRPQNISTPMKEHQLFSIGVWDMTVFRNITDAQGAVWDTMIGFHNIPSPFIELSRSLTWIRSIISSQDSLCILYIYMQSTP